MNRKIVSVDRKSIEAREAAQKFRCQEQGLDVVSVSYHFKNGKKKKKTKFRKGKNGNY